MEPSPRRRRADAGRPVADYLGFLRSRGQLTQAQYLAACLVREIAEPPAQQSRLTMLAGSRRGGDVHAARIDARRRLMRLIAGLPADLQGVFLQVVVQHRSLTEIEPNARRRRRLAQDLRHALDLVFRTLAADRPGAQQRTGR
jgi:DNA-directed RNA polymerase specialized sigma24 family protein